MRASVFLIVALSAVCAVAAADDTAQLQIGVLKKVEDCARKSKVGDHISVHYEGTLDDGKKFDSSYDRHAPFSLTLGTGMVIPGWEQGLLDMCVGEVRKLKIPPHLAYGEKGSPPIIPENAHLTFKVEMVKISDKPADDIDDYEYDEEDEEYQPEGEEL
mmetsp:Transcript_5548/g.16548  ORF Transcript_5548/g.16548 Transcript_5548/m.16548 type:complete len:159 (-) Transcript_5548:1555-2031(-)